MVAQLKGMQQQQQLQQQMLAMQQQQIEQQMQVQDGAASLGHDDARQAALAAAERMSAVPAPENLKAIVGGSVPVQVGSAAAGTAP